VRFRQRQEPAATSPAGDGTQRIVGGRQTPAAAPSGASQPPDETIVQLADRIRIQFLSERGEIRIQLRPEFLGHVEIRAEEGPDGLVARIYTESASVRDYLDSRVTGLEKALQDQGLRVERIEVSIQDSAQSQSGTFDGNRGHAGNRGGQLQGRSPSGSMDQSVAPGITDTSSAVRIGPNSTFHTIA
jgi:flagellar hook-length control protein FliK